MTSARPPYDLENNGTYFRYVSMLLVSNGNVTRHCSSECICIKVAKVLRASAKSMWFPRDAVASPAINGLLEATYEIAMLFDKLLNFGEVRFAEGILDMSHVGR